MKKRISALQIGTKPQGTQATLEAILSFENAIKEAQTDLVVMPEALLGGYPKGEIFGTRLGYRLPEGRESFKQYFDEAIAVPGPETRELADLAARLNTNLVIGVIEKQGSTLYCSSLYFTPEDGLAAKHRKLMPTGTERLIWGQGDGSTLPAINTSAGRISGAICWENHMPLLRMALYGKGVDIWCAPTVDEREIWQCSMRHIAHEGRMFLVSACQVQPSPDAWGIEVANWESQRPLIAGGSVIVSPMGDILAGPLKNEEGLITADIDLEDLKRARYDFDVNGHYARPDVFSLQVDESEKRSVVYSKIR